MNIYTSDISPLPISAADTYQLTNTPVQRRTITGSFEEQIGNHLNLHCVANLSATEGYLQISVNGEYG